MAAKYLLCFLTITVFVSAHCFVVIEREKHNFAAENNASDILPAKYIAGGHPADVGQFPWIARLVDGYRINGKKRMRLCAGTLIGARHVITAAHCLPDGIENYNDVEIYLGEHDTKTNPVDCAHGKCTKNVHMHPDKIIKHADYDRNAHTNDIALLRLTKPATLSGLIKVIPLPPFDIDQPRNGGMSLGVIGCISAV